jgi:hypothetical protein
MPTTSSANRLARATENLVDILHQPHPATPFLQQGTVINDAMEQLSKIFSPPTRVETAMAVPTPRVLEPVTAAPRVGETSNNNNNHHQPPRVTIPTTTTTTTTALDQLRNRLATKKACNIARSSDRRTNSVRRLKPILEEKTTHPLETIIQKKFKKGTLNGKITSYDKVREYYMVEYEDGDSEELRHKSVERYIVTADTHIDQFQKLIDRGYKRKLQNKS